MASLQRELAPGDEVMMGAGIFGTVTSADDDTLHLEVSPGVVLRVARGAVVRRVLPEEPEQPEQLPSDATGEPTPTDDLPADRDH
jgi:preprotein translocase subunit YajC